MFFKSKRKDILGSSIGSFYSNSSLDSGFGDSLPVQRRCSSATNFCSTSSLDDSLLSQRSCSDTISCNDDSTSNNDDSFRTSNDSLEESHNSFTSSQDFQKDNQVNLNNSQYTLKKRQDSLQTRQDSIFDDSWDVLNSSDIWNSWDTICLDDEGEEGQEEGVVAITINIPDGRLDTESEEVPPSRTVLRLSPAEPANNQANGFRINLSTSHYAFSRGRSSTIRSISSFYTLANILKSQHQYVSVSSLPVRPFIYLQNQRAQADLLASWLAGVLVNRELLSNRSLHLFLQTDLSMKLIVANSEGSRDDQVVSNSQTNQYRTKDGFLIIVGRKYTGSHRMYRDHHESRHL